MAANCAAASVWMAIVAAELRNQLRRRARRVAGREVHEVARHLHVALTHAAHEKRGEEHGKAQDRAEHGRGKRAKQLAPLLR